MTRLALCLLSITLLAAATANADPTRAGITAAGVAGAGFTTLEVYERGTNATEVGTYDVMDKGGQVIDHGKYIVVWRREKGQWKLHRDMYSSNTTAATAK